MRRLRAITASVQRRTLRGRPAAQSLDRDDFQMHSSGAPTHGRRVLQRQCANSKQAPIVYRTWSLNACLYSASSFLLAWQLSEAVALCWTTFWVVTCAWRGSVSGGPDAAFQQQCRVNAVVRTSFRFSQLKPVRCVCCHAMAPRRAGTMRMPGRPTSTSATGPQPMKRRSNGQQLLIPSRTRNVRSDSTLSLSRTPPVLQDAGCTPGALPLCTSQAAKLAEV